MNLSFVNFTANYFGFYWYFTNNAPVVAVAKEN